MRLISPLCLMVLFGAGCVVPEGLRLPEVAKPEVVFPIENYREGRTYRLFGEYFQNRFTGYHVADDIEVADVLAEVPVVAIAAGTVTRVSDLSGYGGLVVIDHQVAGEAVTALYGHLDLGSVAVGIGDVTEAGQFIGNLGDHRSSETDGERKHLHFGLHPSTFEKVLGYEMRETNIYRWLNPTDFFAKNGLSVDVPARSYDLNLAAKFDNEVYLGSDIFRLTFDIPEGWDVEYVPQIEALNLFDTHGPGAAGERSQIFIRYFDADDFLTLPSVHIFSEAGLTVGHGSYMARRYDIEKKPSQADFPFQPVWRNTRHIVTDFRQKEGPTRYFVVAKNPDLDMDTYEEVLASMQIIP